MPAHGYRVGSLLAGLLSLLAGNAVARWPTDGANADTDGDRERERLPFPPGISLPCQERVCDPIV